eukprot:6181455-Pleurochrysis_carterae.AAC.2
MEATAIHCSLTASANATLMPSRNCNSHSANVALAAVVGPSSMLYMELYADMCCQSRCPRRTVNRKCMHARRAFHASEHNM